MQAKGSASSGSVIELRERRVREIVREEIREALKPIEDRLTALESRMDSLENRMDSLEKKVDALDAKLDALMRHFKIHLGNENGND